MQRTGLWDPRPGMKGNILESGRTVNLKVKESLLQMMDSGNMKVLTLFLSSFISDWTTKLKWSLSAYTPKILEKLEYPQEASFAYGEFPAYGWSNLEVFSG